MRVYYNEFDPFAAAWLRELMAAGVIPEGVVDERSIVDVQPEDVRGYDQCHFFAGLAGWAEALRLAGWGDRPVWTGSCPCQPFSVAGKGKGASDERHLWPEFARLIRECRPPVVFGEQVASAAVIGGNVAKNKDVQKVLDEQALIRVLREQGGSLEELLSAVQQRKGRESAVRDLFTEANRGPRKGARGGCKVSGRENGPAVRPGRSEYPTADRRGGLRTDGDRVRSADAEGVEYPVAGSNQAGGGLHDGQRPRGVVRDECDGPYLGAEQGHRVGGRGQESEDCPVERLIRTHRDEPQEPPSDWLAGIRHDLGAAGYTFGACALAASSVGAPHIRQRLFWVADANGENAGRRKQRLRAGDRRGDGDAAEQECTAGRLADAYQNRPQGRLSNGEDEGRRTVDGSLGCHGDTVQPSMDSMPVLREFPLHNSPDARARLRVPADRGVADGPVQPIRLGDAASGGRGISGHASQPGSGGHAIGAGGTGLGFWSDYDVIHCRDGKFRRIPRQTQPSVQPVADGLPAGVDGVRIACEGRFPLAGKIPNRTGLLKGAGNAIVPQVAAEFVMAFMEARQ